MGIVKSAIQINVNLIELYFLFYTILHIQVYYFILYYIFYGNWRKQASKENRKKKSIKNITFRAFISVIVVAVVNYITQYIRWIKK